MPLLCAICCIAFGRVVLHCRVGFGGAGLGTAGYRFRRGFSHLATGLCAARCWSRLAEAMGGRSIAFVSPGPRMERGDSEPCHVWVRQRHGTCATSADLEVHAEMSHDFGVLISLARAGCLRIILNKSAANVTRSEGSASSLYKCEVKLVAEGQDLPHTRCINVASTSRSRRAYHGNF